MSPIETEQKKKHRRKSKKKIQPDSIDSTLNLSSLPVDIPVEVAHDTENNINIQSEDGQVHFGLVNPDTKSYFKNIEKILSEDLESLMEKENKDKKESLLSGVYAEIDGNEARLASDLDCSRVLETVLSISDQFFTRVFMDRLAGNYLGLCTHRFASHVIQKLLLLIAVKWINDKEANSEIVTKEENSQPLLPISEMFCMICQELLPNIQQLMVDPYGSHILRLLLVILSGVQENQLVRSKGSQKYQIKHEIQTDEMVPVDYKPPSDKAFKEMFMKMMDSITSFLNPTMVRLFSTHKVANPILQMIIKISAKYSPVNANDLIMKILGTDNKDAAFFKIVATDPAGSHLVQTIIEYSSVEVFKTIFDTLVVENLAFLAFDQCGNYVCQSILTSLKSLEQFQKCHTALKPKISELIFRGRVNIALKLIETAAKFQCGDDLNRDILKAFKWDTEKEGSFELLFRILTLSSFDKGSSDFKPSGGQLLSGLLSLPQPANYIYVSSAVNTPPEQILSLSKDQIAVPSLETFFKSNTVSIKQKRGMAKKFSGHFHELATDKNGSRVLDKIWEVSDISLKEIVAAELVTRKEELSASFYGRIMLRNLKINEFSRNKSEWTHLQKPNKKQKSMHRT